MGYAAAGGQRWCSWALAAQARAGRSTSSAARASTASRVPTVGAAASRGPEERGAWVRDILPAWNNINEIG